VKITKNKIVIRRKSGVLYLCKRKKVICLLLLLFNILCIFIPGKEVKAEPNEKTKVPVVYARNAIAIDAKSKRVLYEKNAHVITPMASTTKIITACVALRYGDLNKKVTISSRAASIRGSVVGYKEGEQVTIKELLYGLMLKSGNDAAIAIAEGISGSVDEFVKLMNEYATEIGLVDTHFESPHGLDSANHYTTAYDLAIATAHAKEIDEFNKIVATKDIDGSSEGFSRSFHNINKILWQIPGANGVKTGYTGQAGKCLVSSVKMDDSDIIIVVINCPGRWKETAKIDDYIKNTYEFKKIVEKDRKIKSLTVEKSKDKLNLKSKTTIKIPVKKGSKVEVKIKVPKEIEAPVYANLKLGTINVYEDKKLIYTTPLYSESDVRKNKGIFRWLK